MILEKKWLIPSTDNKVWDRKSPKWRIFQWQKGIWRYATSVLGNKMNLETIKDWVKTIVNINWEDFQNSEKFLDEIHLDIKSEKTDEKSWTSIIIFWDEEKNKIWTEKQLWRLKQWAFN